MMVGGYEIKRLDPLNILVQQGYERKYFGSWIQAFRFIHDRNIGGDDLKAIVESIEASEERIFEAIKSATKDEVVDIKMSGGAI